MVLYTIRRRKKKMVAIPDCIKQAAELSII